METVFVFVFGTDDSISWVDGKLEAFHPPPTALTSSTLATNWRPKMSTAVRSLVSAAL
jgi:hypothetical protein